MATKLDKKLPGDSSLCDRCRSMTSTLNGLQELASREGYKHFDTIALRRSAAQGCTFCHVLSTHFDSSGDGRNRRTRIQIRSQSTVDPVKLQATANEHPFQVLKEATLDACFSNWAQWKHRFELFTVAGDPGENFLKVQPTSISVNGSIYICKIKERLRGCEKLHKNCPKAQNVSLPSRVIEVGSADGSKLQRPRLHVSQLGDKGQYLALSYRWGGSQHAVTTTANIETRKLGFELASLPRTIQEAIILTRQLNYQYLWVDALCILQDDDHDKASEITRMGQIYKNATCTIAAANTPHADTSFLDPRPLPGKHCIFPYLLPDGTFGTIYIRTNNYGRATDILETRAWSLQESILSPRVLYYGSGDLMWKCQTCDFEEVNKMHTLDLFYFWRWQYRLARVPAAVFGIKDSSSPLRDEVDEMMMEYRAQIWEAIVENYSGRHVTLPEDRLPALAGIASELNLIWGDQYLAGLWRSTLLRQLTWGNKGGSLYPPSPYHSPSWSWISYNREARFYPVVDARAEILQCEVLLKDSEAPFSAVEEGRLVLRAQCWNPGSRLSKTHAIWRFLTARNRTQAYYFRRDDRRGQVVGKLPFVGKQPLVPGTLFALIGYGDGSDFQALIIEPSGNGTFKRVGLLQGHGVAKWPKIAKERVVIIM